MSFITNGSSLFTTKNTKQTNVSKNQTRVPNFGPDGAIGHSTIHLDSKGYIQEDANRIDFDSPERQTSWPNFWTTSLHRNSVSHVTMIALRRRGLVLEPHLNLGQKTRLTSVWSVWSLLKPRDDQVSMKPIRLRLDL